MADTKPNYAVGSYNCKVNKLYTRRHNMPPPAVRWTLQRIPYTCGAQRALLPIAVGAMNINDVCESATIFPRLCKLTFDLLTLKVVSESCVTWATCVPILVFLSLSVLKLFLMYATDRQTSDSIIA